MRLLPSIALLFGVQSSHAKRDNREGGDAIQARQAWPRPITCAGDVILYSQEDADKKIGNCTHILGNITISTAAAGEIRIEDSTLGIGPVIFEEAVNCPLQPCPELNGNLTSLYIGARLVTGIFARGNFKALTHLSMPNLQNISTIHIEGLKGLQTIELPRRFEYGIRFGVKRELYIGSVPKLTTFGSSDYTSTIVSLEDRSPIEFFDVGLRTVRLERIDGVHRPTISMEDPGGIQMLKLADGNETFVGGGSASLHYDPADRCDGPDRCDGRLQLSGLSNVSFAQPADGSGYKTVFCREVSFSNNTFSSVVLPFDASQQTHWWTFEMKDNDQLETLHFALERDEDRYAAEFDDPYYRHNLLGTINIANNPKLRLKSYFDIYARHPEAWNWAFTYGEEVTLVGHFDNAFFESMISGFAKLNSRQASLAFLKLDVATTVQDFDCKPLEKLMSPENRNYPADFLDFRCRIIGEDEVADVAHRSSSTATTTTLTAETTAADDATTTTGTSTPETTSPGADGEEPSDEPDSGASMARPANWLLGVSGVISGMASFV